MFRLSFLMLAGALLLACAQKNQFELPLEHQMLAIKLGANNLGKSPAAFTKQDSMHSFFAFNYYLKDALKEYPKPEINTQEHFSLVLMTLWRAMDEVLERDAFDMRDSLDTSTFFGAIRFSSPVSYQKKLLDGATFDDYVLAYSIYLHEKKIEHRITTKNETLNYLKLEFREPFSHIEPTPGQKAFAYIRARLLYKKINASLSEKQKLLMQGRSSEFIASLSEQQAKMFSEFQKYSKLVNIK